MPQLSAVEHVLEPGGIETLHPGDAAAGSQSRTNESNGKRQIDANHVLGICNPNAHPAGFPFGLPLGILLIAQGIQQLPSLLGTYRTLLNHLEDLAPLINHPTR